MESYHKYSQAISLILYQESFLQLKTGNSKNYEMENFFSNLKKPDKPI